MDNSFLSDTIRSDISSDCSTEKLEDVLSLVQRAKSGDLSAFDSLILRYRQRLYAVLYNMTMNTEDAADLAQETFVKAFRSLAKFKEQSSFYTWLYRIGVNLTLTHLKRRKILKFLALIKPVKMVG